MRTGESLDAYLDREVPADPGMDAGLVRAVRQHLRAGLARVAAIPRTDPFWVGTNGEPSLTKVERLHEARLRADPGDVEARWTLFALVVAHAANDFGAPYLEPLIGTDPDALPMLRVAARWVRDATGYDTSAGLQALEARAGGRGQ